MVLATDATHRCLYIVGVGNDLRVGHVATLLGLGGDWIPGFVGCAPLHYNAVDGRKRKGEGTKR
jgi:hypothetical protein